MQSLKFQKITFGKIYNRLIAFGWRELSGRIPGGNISALRPCETAWVKPECVSKWVKDNPFKLKLVKTLNVIYILYDT